LAQLAAWLTEETATAAALMPAISGVGGIGKTQVAIQFAHQYRERYPGGVFWISAEQTETIELQLALCGARAGLGLFDEDPQLSERLRSSRSVPPLMGWAGAGRGRGGQQGCRPGADYRHRSANRGRAGGETHSEARCCRCRAAGHSDH